MAQFGRPVQDIAAWATGTFADIDEASADDADKITSNTAPANHVYVCKLGTLEDPVSSTGHILSWRRQKNASGGSAIDLLVELRQGYVNESSKGTLITSKNAANIANGFADDSITLSGPEADSITNYGSLFVRIVANQP